MIKHYPCICRGECLNNVKGLGFCIMNADRDDSYCKSCKSNLKERANKVYRTEAPL